MGVGRVGTVRVQILCPGVGFAAFVRARVSQFQHQRVKRPHGETCGHAKNVPLQRAWARERLAECGAARRSRSPTHARRRPSSRRRGVGRRAKTRQLRPSRLRGEQLTRAEGPGRPRGGRGRRQLPQAHGSAPSRAVVRPGPPRSPTGRRSQVCRHALACAAPGAHDLSEEPDASQTVVRSGAPACPGVPGGQRARAQSSAGTQSVCPTLRGVVERGIGMRSSHVREVCGRAGVRHQAEE